MDVFTRLSNNTNYSTTQLQMILGAWVVSTLMERSAKISTKDGDVDEDDYDKRSIYSLLYSLYRSMGEVKSDLGELYEFTFNTWGYAWPKEWGSNPTGPTDPQRFGKNAYTGLFAFPQVKDRVSSLDGKVHVIEMGCGTGAGAHHICREVLQKCTYQALDMQQAAIDTCKRKFIPKLGGRLVATCTDATKISPSEKPADIVAVCETHVTEYPGRVTEEDERFFNAARDRLKPGGFLVWGNAIPDSTWQPCFDYLDSIGMKRLETHDVTEQAIQARDEDLGRMNAYVEQCLNRFHGFRIPILGSKKRIEAEVALKNFARHPGTNLYQNMKTRRDTYRVALFEKTA